MATAVPDDGRRDRSITNVHNTMAQQQGNALQANAVGTVIFNGHAFQLPRELPMSVSGFAGRTDELARLDELLVDHSNGGSSIVLITGPAEIGKTALALHWALRNRAAFPDGEIYLNLGGYGSRTPVQPKDALAAALRSLGDQQSADAPTLDERSKHYRSRLHGKRMLVLLDDARNVEQALPLLPSDHAGLVLLTSRDDLAELPGEPARIGLSALPGSTPPDRAQVTGPSTPDPPVTPAGPPYDVFVSYATEDTEWVLEFVDRLRGHDVRVAHDVLLPGDRIADTVERAITDSQHGLLVFSRAAMDDDWIREQYTVLLHRSQSAGSGPRFIPVVIDDAPLPVFAANRYTCDFRGASSRGYDHLINRLVQAVKSAGTSG